MIHYTAKVGDVALLTRWAKARGEVCHEIAAEELGSVVSSTAADDARGRNTSFVLVDYPIETEEDLSTIDTFITNLKTNSGFWYYAPRPNAYLDVSNAALIGIHPVGRLSGHVPAPYIQKALTLARRVHRRLPPSLKPLTRALGTMVTDSLTPPSQSPTPAMVETQVRNGPTASLPGNLGMLPAEWKEWGPAQDVMFRDLIERGENFFPHPRGIHVITLNKCNLACVMCPYHSPVYKENHTSQYFDKYRAMSLETFQKIADYAGSEKISLQFGQIEEPLMHKKFFDFLHYAHKAGVPHIHLTTNGTLLDKENADELLATGINSVMFSVDAVNPETYFKIRGDDLKKLEDNIRYFVPRAREKGIKTWVSFILQEQARPEREAFLRKWKEIGVDNITFYVLTAHDPKTGAFIRTEEHYDKGKRYPCASPWIQSVVFPDGEVSLCCKTMTDVGWRGVVSVGNASKQHFSEIWRSDRYRAVRRELLKNAFRDFKVCADCSIWSASTYLREDEPDYVRIHNETMETYELRHN
ncbi:MAG: radical SAM protein [Pseudomonadota bacterium]